MDALVIGPTSELTGAVARGLRRQGRAVLQATHADAADRDRARWLLDEAGRPRQVIVFEDAPFPIACRLLALTDAEIVLVAERSAAVAPPTASADAEPGLTVVGLGRAERRWFHLGGGRQAPLGAERAAALVLRACDGAGNPT